MAAASTTEPELAADVAQRVQKAHTEFSDGTKYTENIPFNLVTVSVDQAATASSGRGVYTITLSSVGPESTVESLELRKHYSELTPLSKKAAAVPQLKASLLPSAGMWEKSSDAKVMAARMNALQTFLQATLVAVTTVQGTTVPLDIIKTLCGDSFPGSA